MIGLILWPFGTLLANLPKYRTKYFLNLVWLFFVFYGFVMVSSLEGSDVNRYTSFFEDYANQSLSARLNFVQENQEIDLFRFGSFLFVSFFSKSASVYFAFIGFIFGFYYSRILGLLFAKINKRLGVYGAFMLIAFLFIMDFYSLQFIRFSTAILIFNYYVLKYFFETTKIKYLFLSSLSILVHFSFVFAVIVLFVAVLFKVRPKLLFVFYLGSIFLDLFNFEFVANLIYQFTPAYILETKEGYLNADLITKQNEDFELVNWYIRLRGPILKYTQLFLVALLIFNKRFIETLNKNKVFLSCVLFFGIMSNLLAEIPSGSRFITVFNHLTWFFLIIEIINREKILNSLNVKYILLVPILFNAIVGVRYAMDSVPLDFFFSNPVLAFFFQTNIPIIDYLK